MKFFIDTANVDEIRKVNEMGVICGVTTNPSLIAKEGLDFTEVIKEIASIVDGPISGEVSPFSEMASDMVREGREIAAIHPNMVVKIPMTSEGLKAVKILSAENIKTNVTLVFSANQALMAARAGATYVSPFLGRLDDISDEGISLIEEIVRIFDNYAINTEIIAASIRGPIHVKQCAMAGADIATIPYSVIIQMISHPLTSQGIDKFKADHMKVFGNKAEIIELSDARFKKYGCVVDNVDFTALVKELGNVKITNDVAYEPSIDNLEKALTDSQRDALMGGLELQVGYCGGHNVKNTLIEYHKSSEVNVAATDAVLYLGSIQDIKSDGTVSENSLEAFRVPAGTAVELYSTTLHYAPCQTDDNGFMVGIILPKGTNLPVSDNKETDNKDEYLAAANKWLHKIV